MANIRLSWITGYVVQINLWLKFSWANINTIDNIIQYKYSERMQLLQFRYLQTSASLFILQAKSNIKD